jgi:hypothetical protein
MENFEDQIKFIKRHAEQITPVVEEKELVQEIAQYDGAADFFARDKERVEKVLEDFETKLFTHDKREGDFELTAKRVLLSMSETFAGRTMNPIINELKKDQRCRGMILLTDSKSGEQFVKEKDADFEQVREEKLLLADALKIAEKEKIDAALVTVEPIHSPSAAILFGGKSVFGAEKLYFLVSSWIGFGSGGEIFKPERYKNMDEIDGFFVADELTKKVLRYQLPDYPESKIIITGTPVTDVLELSKAEKYGKSGREKLGLKDEEIAMLYVGDSSVDAEKDINPRFNEETYQRSLQAVIQAAESSPEKKFAFLVRPHPRDTEESKVEMMKIPSNLPPNLKFMPAPIEKIPMQEAAYASDVVMSICSTENILSSLRGKEAIYLGYEQDALGGRILEKLLGPDLMKIFDEQENISIVPSPDALTEYLQKYNRPERPVSEKGETPEKNSVQKIVDIILGGDGREQRK